MYTGGCGLGVGMARGGGGGGGRGGGVPPILRLSELQQCM